jgi:hypothetical protein
MPDRSDKISVLVETTGMPLVREIAETGWLVEVAPREPNQQSDSRFFAVALGNAIAAEEAVLRYPGILQTDKRSAMREREEKIAPAKKKAKSAIDGRARRSALSMLV